MADTGILRALCLFGPAVIAALLWSVRRPSRQEAVGACLASAWNLPALLFVHWLAQVNGWWGFSAQGGLLLGLPVDLYLGWCLLWGVIPMLACPRCPLWLVLAVFGYLDVLLMPLCAPLVGLGRNWLAGEAVALLSCLVPAQWLGRWTREGRHVGGRAALQAVCAGGLAGGVLPAAALSYSGGAGVVHGHPLWATVLVVSAVVALSAVQEFAERGRGTPIPYDPPRQLVTSGLYRYVRNPMQVGFCLFMACWGAILGSAWVAAASLLGWAYGMGLARWSEEEDLRRRFGASWAAYTRNVRSWVPRWRPWSGGAATLYVADTCGLCANLREWLLRRHPVGLELLAAERHPRRALVRATYDAGDGSPEVEGVVAFARSLEHLHLGWALLGSVLRLPGIASWAQWVADGLGAGPRRVRPGVASE